MRNGPDSTAVVQALEPDNFGNRKLIRPSLNREQARVAEERLDFGQREDQRQGDDAEERAHPREPAAEV